MTTRTPRRGRPRKISRDDIARAALDIGLREATIRKVAAALGVSVMGIYHHVRNAEELQDLAMAMELKTLLGTVEQHETFEATLFDAAKRYYEILIAHPQMLTRLVGGQINPQGTALYLESVLTSGRRHGLTELEAFHAARSVLCAAAGAAAMNAHLHKSDSPNFLEVVAEGVGQLTSGRVPHVDALLAAGDLVQPDPMEPVRMTLLGLRTTFGERMTGGAQACSPAGGA